MPQSVTRLAINKISKTVMESGFKALGFRRQSNHLHRKSIDLFHGVRFQASQWGVSEQGSFTVNLVIVWETQLQRELGNRFPSNPATALEPVATRIGSLMPGEFDHWWDVDMETDLAALCGDLAEALNDYAVPYFDHFPDRESVLTNFRNGGARTGFHEKSLPIHHAIVAHDLGYMSEAQDRLKYAIQVCDNADQCSQIMRLAEKLKLNID